MDENSTAMTSTRHHPVAAREEELNPVQRAAYVTAGLILAAAAARPRPNWGLSLLALGAGSLLAWHGAEGRCPVKGALVRNGFMQS
ncbi:hypothetical protein ACFOD4_08235 [Pseudoroseomonas globiformis]|uniref:DUF2892 domain-containing protein n=1 Tax=Teichococcus globiformis TaxID=2307229 RepID=A0ABV7G0M5_9PROT